MKTNPALLFKKLQRFGKNCLKKDNIFKLFIVLWPTIVGLLSTSYYSQVAYCSSLAFNWKYQLDFVTFLFWSVSIIWLFIFLISVVIEDESVTRKFDRIRATIIKAPDMTSFSDARTVFDHAYMIIERLKKIDDEFREEIKNNQVSKKNDLLVALTTINNSILYLAQAFFKNKDIDGISCMLFFKCADCGDTIAKLCLKSDQLYMRCDYFQELSGILYLDTFFMTKNGSMLENKPLTMPIYTNYLNVYKNPNDLMNEIIVPGAMSAYKKGTAMIGDTLDTNKYYNMMDERTQREMYSYFKNNVVGVNVKSFASFQIPPPISEPDTPIGILNLDSKALYSFGEDEEFFASFYTLIYPMLKSYSEHLLLYKQYIKISI